MSRYGANIPWQIKEEIAAPAMPFEGIRKRFKKTFSPANSMANIQPLLGIWIDARKVENRVVIEYTAIPTTKIRIELTDSAYSIP